MAITGRKALACELCGVVLSFMLRQQQAIRTKTGAEFTDAEKESVDNIQTRLFPALASMYKLNTDPKCSDQKKRARLSAHLSSMFESIQNMYGINTMDGRFEISDALWKASREFTDQRRFHTSTRALSAVAKALIEQAGENTDLRDLVCNIRQDLRVLTENVVPEEERQDIQIVYDIIHDALTDTVVLEVWNRTTPLQ